jgi:thioesterase domain-containing protein
LRTVEAMAARLNQIIRAVQPAGPYRLAGWSFGGKLAYEIAKQLIGDDEDVEFLGLIDTSYNPSPVQPPETDEAILRDLILSSTGDESSVPHEFSALVSKCQELSLLPEKLSAGAIRQLISRGRVSDQASRDYIAQPIPVSIHLFAAQDAPFDDVLYGWNQLIPAERIHRIPVAGNHHSMLQAPNVASLGKVLLESMQRAREFRLIEPTKAENLSLVTIQTGSSRELRMFCVPGAGANAASFVDLAGALGPNWEVCAFQPRGLDSRRVPHSTVRTAAMTYLNAMDKNHPNDPVHLLGHSFGGWVAFEMALQLHAAGRDLASLTLIDTEVPGSTERREYNRTEVLLSMIRLFEQAAERSLGIVLNELEVLDANGQLELLHERLVEARLMPVRSSAQVLLRPVCTFETAIRTSYRPTAVYPGPVRLVQVADGGLSNDDNEQNFAESLVGWKRFAPNVTPWRGPGNHMTVLKMPHVLDLAQLESRE